MLFPTNITQLTTAGEAENYGTIVEQDFGGTVPIIPLSLVLIRPEFLSPAINKNKATVRQGTGADFLTLMARQTAEQRVFQYK